MNRKPVAFGAAGYDGPEGQVTGLWTSIPQHFPNEYRQYENSVTGVSFLYGGGWWEADKSIPQPLIPYSVRHTDGEFGWVFDGTDLSSGDEFGVVDAPSYLVGLSIGGRVSIVRSECDGAEFPSDYKDPVHAQDALHRDLPLPSADAAEWQHIAPHTPRSTRILASASLKEWVGHGGLAFKTAAWATMVAYHGQGEGVVQRWYD